MPEEKLHTEETVHEDEGTVGETVPEGERTEPEESKDVVHAEEACQNKDKCAEDELQREGGQTGEAVRDEETCAGEKIEKKEEDTEESAYEERGAMGEMAEQDWNTEVEEEMEPDIWEEEPKKRSFFRRNREDAHFLRDKWILSRISDKDLMEYLVLEQKRNEQLQKAKDIREKRIVSAFKLTVSLAAGVAVVYLLKDNPTIFVNILYIGGILGGFWFWKNSHEK